MRVIKKLLLIVMLVAAVFAFGCEADRNSATERETQTQSKNAESLAQNQPAEGMDWSPTRNNLLKWADKWEEQGKLSYVYFFGANGEKVGYFIFEGLPTSYCASLTSPDKINKVETYGSPNPAVVTTAPALDAAYYSGSNCAQFFGYEAGTGNYFEFTIGGSFNYFLSDSPLTELDMQPLGNTTEEEAARQ